MIMTWTVAAANWSAVAASWPVVAAALRTALRAAFRRKAAALG